MKFTAKIYKLGKSGRKAAMLPKEVSLEVGEYEFEIASVPENIPEIPVESPVESMPTEVPPVEP